MKSPIVSIILPVYNGSKYIEEAINSVLHQSYEKWELLIINDGSTDATKDEIFKFSDRRIKYYEQENRGVSAARNLAIDNMQGDYFCFLDADDAMTPESLMARLNIFKKNSDVSFVDGKVIYMNSNMKPTGREYIPRFKGTPYYNLLRLSSSCYFGPSWMIRYDPIVKYNFREGMTHAEDLLFYLTISKTGKYDYTHRPVLYYRDNSGSAMKDLQGLEEGYSKLLESVRLDLRPNTLTYNYLKYRVIRIMFLSHLRNGRDPASAFKSLFRFLLKV